MNAPKRRSDRRIIWPAVLIVGLMFGLGFALVPLYDVFCEYTGLNGKLSPTAAAEKPFVPDLSRTVSVELLATVSGAMPLKFWAETKKLKVHPGEYQTVRFYGVNQSAVFLKGRAIPSIAPGWAAQFLQKTQCFCFEEQRFEPKETKEMVVRFVVDPALPETVSDMSLSYTFFDITDP